MSGILKTGHRQPHGYEAGTLGFGFTCLMSSVIGRAAIPDHLLIEHGLVATHARNEHGAGFSPRSKLSSTQNWH